MRPLSGVSRPGSRSWEELPGEMGVVSSMNMYFESGRPRKPAPQWLRARRSLSVPRD